MSRPCNNACRRYGVCDCERPPFIARQIVLWHRDPWGARRHPYTDDERSHRDAKLELVVASIVTALGLLGLWASSGG